MCSPEKINSRLKEDYNYLETLGYVVLGVFLQGSQNYNLDYANSDIDTKAIIIPKVSGVILNKKPVSTTIVKDDNSHLDVKDIRLFIECFKKQNINFLEILFTKYYLLNPLYEPLFMPMLLNAEEIAHYNNYAAVNCIAGLVFEKYKALEHPYPSLIDKIEKYGFDPKQLHHILRCEEFLARYVSGETYRNCLVPTDPDYLIKVKSNCPYTLDVARVIAEQSVEHVKAVKQKYMDTHAISINSYAEDVMQAVLVNVIKKAFTIELS